MVLNLVLNLAWKQGFGEQCNWNKRKHQRVFLDIVVMAGNVGNIVYYQILAFVPQALSRDLTP